jgi:hypothetical protein
MILSLLYVWNLQAQIQDYRSTARLKSICGGEAGGAVERENSRNNS